MYTPLYKSFTPDELNGRIARQINSLDPQRNNHAATLQHIQVIFEIPKSDLRLVPSFIAYYPYTL